jgi:hypothetical protein
MTNDPRERDADESARRVERERRPYAQPSVQRIGTVTELTEDAGNAGNPDGTYPLSNYGG